MARGNPSVRLTGGAGFRYEDQVGAWFILQMVNGRQPLGPDYGTVAKVSFQVRDRGWLLDDLLITLHTPQTECRLPLSIKSYKYVTRRGFPSEFVDLLWRQWLGIDSSTFDAQRDLFGLVVSRLADSVKHAWHDLLQQAVQTEPARMADRLGANGQSSQFQRAIFHSLQCPPALRRPDGTDAIAAGELLRRLRLIHLGLRENSGSGFVDAIAICQSTLQSGDSSEAADLWHSLVEFASELRASGGDADLPRAVRRLGAHFNLDSYPDHRKDRHQISRVSQEAMGFIRGDIQGHSLTRDALCNGVCEKTRSSRVLALLGESGCGKSALAKFLLQSKYGSEGVWLNHDVLDCPDLVSVEQRIGISHHFVEVLRSAPSVQALLVIDGVDGFSPQALANVGRILIGLGLEDDDYQWHVVMTCQPDHWSNVLNQLTAYQIPLAWISQMIVEKPGLPEVRSLLGGFPSLRLATFNTDILPLLCNLKTLDWIVRAAVSDPDVATRGWASISDMIECIWQYWTSGNGNRYTNASTLKKLGGIEGDAFTLGAPISALDSSEREALPRLQSRGLLRTPYERVVFTHDLAGDWARLHFLVGEHENLTLLKSKARLPRWHRAIRMYVQWLLDKKNEGVTQWRNTIAQLNTSTLDDIALRDLYLEAVALAVNASQLLERVWDDLVGNNACLLARLLKRFLHAATIPHPRIILIAESEQDVGGLAAIMRVPYWPYWGPVLSFLHRHRTELPVSIQKTVAEVCCLWLQVMPPKLPSGNPWPWRREAAETAVQTAREVQAVKAEGTYFRDDEDQKAYEAALHAAADISDAVAQLALELCGRKDLDPEIASRVEQVKERERRQRDEYLKNHPEKAKQLV